MKKISDSFFPVSLRFLDLENYLIFRVGIIDRFELYLYLSKDEKILHILLIKDLFLLLNLFRECCYENLWELYRQVCNIHWLYTIYFSLLKNNTFEMVDPKSYNAWHQKIIMAESR